VAGLEKFGVHVAQKNEFVFNCVFKSGCCLRYEAVLSAAYGHERPKTNVRHVTLQGVEIEIAVGGTTVVENSRSSI
jgi:hypothetical protein